MFSEKYHGYIDESGQWQQHEDGDLIVRYDQFSNPWCTTHNCKLAQCRDEHPRHKRSEFSGWQPCRKP